MKRAGINCVLLCEGGAVSGRGTAGCCWEPGSVTSSLQPAASSVTFGVSFPGMLLETW